MPGSSKAWGKPQGLGTWESWVISRAGGENQHHGQVWGSSSELWAERGSVPGSQTDLKPNPRATGRAVPAWTVKEKCQLTATNASASMVTGCAALNLSLFPLSFPNPYLLGSLGTGWLCKMTAGGRSTGWDPGSSAGVSGNP